MSSGPRGAPAVRNIVDGAILVEYPGSLDEANRGAIGAARRLAARTPAGLLDVVPAARTLLVLFDPARLGHERIARDLAAERERAESSTEERRTLEIPACYGAEAGRDLEELAREAGMTPAEFARRHAAAAYRVAFLGFAPGFPYLSGLPRELHAPRLATPRTRVEAGSVGIGGPYSGIYPEQTPGGWRLIGRSPVRLFDAERNPPALLLPGDDVRFHPIGRTEFERMLSILPPRSAADRDGDPLFRVEVPGAWTSVQGQPRYGWSRYGVAPGGAMDLPSLAIGNALLGNSPGAAALEIALSGPRIQILGRGRIALAGAACEAELNGASLALGRVLEVRPGDDLRIGRLRNGVYSYLCVAGGLARRDRPEPTRRLAAGDTVSACHPSAPLRASTEERSDEESAPSREQILPPSLELRRTSPSAQNDRVLRVVLGPQEESFEREGLEAFLGGSYRVSSQSDRRGIRLEGAEIAHRVSPDIEPEGTALGAIQVPRDGQPIVLGPDRPVTGGYTKIATVIGADFPLLAQAPAATAFRFRAVTLAEALAARSRMTP